MGTFSKYRCQQFLVLTICAQFWSTMNSISLLCLLPLLTSVLALPAADLLDHVLDPNEEHLYPIHPNQEQEAADSHVKQETAASNNGEVWKRGPQIVLSS